MPFWLSVANFLNGLCWTSYALIHPFDIYVLISNGIGAISELVQLILYAYYYSRKEECNEQNGDHGHGHGHVTKPTGVEVGWHL
ncbi:SWEET sugar transporter [Sesbania bispinosa]|nr:SWEET sugar transporter [Sesbania bispinosa]